MAEEFQSHFHHLLAGSYPRSQRWPTGAAQIVLGGIIAGIFGSLASTGMLRSLLFGVKPHDWTTLVLACLVLTGAATAAYVPARRAARMAPVDALRME